MASAKKPGVIRPTVDPLIPAPFGVDSESWQTNLGAIAGATTGRVSRDLILYLASRRGEVAEWLKAMVC
jgi:hypothetical protein